MYFKRLILGKVKADYRADIDGLRAIACICVVIFHAFPGVLSGGFVGVDIFFVISGFLISSILYRNLFDKNSPARVDLIDFYIRRVRRIFPALLAVLITTLVLGWFVLIPEEYSVLGKHTLGGATYINNLMLYSESDDYFDVSSNAKPLLHLWSLGVEEQFYLIFPVLLWLLYRFKLNYVLSLALFTLISFFLNINAVNHNRQTYAFYLPWCRFWELSIGAILAYIVNYYQDAVAKAKSAITDKTVVNTIFKFICSKRSDEIRGWAINNVISLTGLFLILYAVITVNNDNSFPGTKALMPVIGSLMIIAAGKCAFINKYILSNRLMVFIGLICYPLYLWHWVLLSMSYICEGQLPSTWIRVVAVVLSVVLSVLTYLVIEPPLRYGTNSKKKALGLFIVLIAVGLGGGWIYSDEGVKSRFKDLQFLYDPELSYEKYGANRIFSIDDKFIDNCNAVFPHWNDQDSATTCAMQKIGSHNNIAIVGSSHAANLFYGLSSVYKNTDNAVAVFPMGSQLPFIRIQTLIQGRTDWYKRIEDAYDYIESNKNLKIIILSDLADVGLDPQKIVDVDDGNEKNYEIILKNAIIRSLDRLKDRHTIILLDTPWVPFNPTLCYQRKFSFSEKTCSFMRSTTSDIRDIHNRIIKDVVASYDRVLVVDTDPLFCEKEMCRLKDEHGVPLYIDEHHLSSNGSLMVGRYLKKFIDDLLSR
ncbi:MAG: acyltransferase family protein [Succinivibrio sp.]